MSEFKLTGDFYVSQWNGASLNPGTPTQPYAHPNDAPSANNKVIIGPGEYTGSQGTKSRKHADGLVVFNFNGLNNTIGCDYAQSLAEPAMRGVYVKNCNSFKGNSHIGGGTSGWFTDCVFQINEFPGDYRNSDSLVRCILQSYTSGQIIKTLNNLGNIFPNFLYNCIILDDLHMAGDRSSSSIYQYCYLPFGKKIFITANAPITATTFSGSMINGIINYAGTDYESKRLKNGTSRPDANPSIADIVTIAPSFYANGGFSGDPKFIDLFNRIVEPDSELLSYSGAYGFIGGVRPGKKIPVNSSDSNVSITFSNINTSDPSNVTIQSPATEGQIDIIWKVSDNIAEIQRIFLDALLTFNGSQAGGSVGNNNVPDIFPTSYTPLSQAGLKPNRLLYRLRTSQSIAMPSTDGQWDNDNVALGTTPGSFYLQEWNTKPVIVTVLGVRYGNGNPESIGGTPNGINARWAHARIRLTNNRAF